MEDTVRAIELHAAERDRENELIRQRNERLEQNGR